MDTSTSELSTAAMDGVEVLPAPTTGAAIMTRCSECHHLVPEANLALHQATACRQVPQGLDDTVVFDQQEESTSEQRDDSPPQQQQQQQGASVRNWFFGLFRKRTTTTDYPSQRLSSQEDEDWQMVQRQDADEWTCPRCTLDNSNSLSRCSACSYARQQEQPSRHEPSSPLPHQVPPSDESNTTNSSSLPPGSFMGGGAVLGGILGGLFGALVGNPIGGAIEGCMNGAFSGAILENASRMQQQQSMARGRPQHGGRMPLTRIRYPDGRVQIVAGDPNMIRASMMQQRSADPSSFERVLQSSLNEQDTSRPTRGADQQALASLPVTRVQQDDKICGEQCPICLESFQEGDSYKTLPCMHGFHAHCADHWLRKNASCPMCKRSIAS